MTVFVRTAVAAGVLLACGGAYAQALEEVVVTAQRRAESLQDVPISVSVVSGTRIQDSAIQRSEDLSAFVPNFTVMQDPIGDKINIRGIQSGNQAGFEQSVATFVDDIYRGRGTQARWSFLDLERVEVLRGPQPILFGKNTVAGALNITSARPTDVAKAELSVAYNPEFDEREIQALVSGPLSESVRGRVVVLSRQMDEGWVTNASYPEDNPSSEEFFARASLDWDIGERTSMYAKFESGKFDVVGQPWVIWEGGPITPLLTAAGVPEGPGFDTAMGNNGFAVLGLPGDDVIDFGSVGRYEGQTQEGLIRLDHTLRNDATLTAILGHSAYDYDRFLDADFNPLPVVRFDDTEDFEQNSLELRLTSNTGGRVDYIAGLYYQDNDMYVDGLSQFNVVAIDALLGGTCAALPGGPGAVVVGDPVATAVGASALPGATAAVANACAQTALTQALLPSGLNGAGRYAFLDQTTETLAGFGQLTYNFSDTVRTTVGLRYTTEDKKASQSAYATDYVERGTVPLADQSPTNPQALAAFLVGEFTFHEFAPSDPGMTRDEDSLTWAVNLQWDVSENLMVYGSASTGFKAGGYNSFYMGLPQGLGASSEDVQFEDEEVLAFEVGAKMLFADGRAELNLAAFHMSYEDLQASIFSGNTTFVVQNAAEATSRGIEFDGRWQATDGLMLTGSVGWLDFSYDEFPNQGCVAEQFLAFREEAFQQAVAASDFLAAGVSSLVINNQVCASAGVNDLAGRPSAHSPEFTASLAVDYRAPIGSRYEFATIFDVSWSDDVYRQDDLDPLSLQESFTKANLAMMFGPTEGQWDVGIIGKNIFDEVTTSYVNDMPLFDGARQGRMDPPASWAVRARFRF